MPEAVFSAVLRRGSAAVGLLICEDAGHPSAPYLLVQDGAEILIVISNAPAKGMGARGMSAEENWYGLLTNHSLLHGAISLFANRVGTEDGVTFFGGSAVVRSLRAVPRAGRAV